VEEALKEGNQAVVADLDASEVLQPGVGAFDFPAFAVSAQLAFVFEAAMTVVAAVGSDQLCAALFQPFAQRIGVISAVCNHASQTGTGASRATARHLHRTECAFCKPVFGICADASCAPTGTPRPSTTTTHFVPFPRRVVPTAT